MLLYRPSETSPPPVRRIAIRSPQLLVEGAIGPTYPFCERILPSLQEHDGSGAGDGVAEGSEHHFRLRRRCVQNPFD